MQDDYVFYFVGGSGGNFLQAIVYHYLTEQDVSDCLDIENGSCHNLQFFQWVHYLEDAYPMRKTKKIVAIDYEESDVLLIGIMQWFKFFKPCKPVTDRFWHKYKNLTEQEQLDLWIKQEHQKIVPTTNEWKKSLELLKPTYVFNFHDLFFGNINQQIAELFNRPLSDQISKFIDDYRNINLKYQDIANAV